MSDFDETLRYGGPQADEGGDDAARKAEERERKKAEVRKRLEEAGSKKKAKKGFLTPERKKKLRKLLMMKAAEDLKQQQLLKAQERQKALASRIIPLPDVDKIEDKGQLEKIYNDMFERVKKLEEEKYDINFIVTQTEAEINELTIAVNDLRGKLQENQFPIPKPEVSEELKSFAFLHNQVAIMERMLQGVENSGGTSVAYSKELSLFQP
ncbi:hypothetical protein Y032_0059g3054 [Ancylostoma ceylanicum]|uniref:Troponin n=1 Tax=Ancylostoma ceylanicum TaxID=53326 RepID=A0A016U487_9BILA|nr:hypothetical protein Y032_0059g3054 [Ancylostoma ceylanicum]